MAISPSSQRAVAAPVLQEWLKKHKVHLLGITSVPQNQESKVANEENYKVLCRLLSEKGIVSLDSRGHMEFLLNFAQTVRDRCLEHFRWSFGEQAPDISNEGGTVGGFLLYPRRHA